MSLAPGVAHDLLSTLEKIRVDGHAGRAELLGDLDFDELADLAAWVRAERQKWRAQRDAALAAAASACEQAGAIARGLVYAQRLVESDPLAEHAQRRVMRLHYLRGDRAAARLAACNASVFAHVPVTHRSDWEEIPRRDFRDH